MNSNDQTCSKAEDGAGTTEPLTPLPSYVATLAKTPATPGPSKPLTDSELANVANNLSKELLDCLGNSTRWLVQAGLVLAYYQCQVPHGQMTAIHNSGRLPWGQRYCQVLTVLARNPALHHAKLLQHLPTSVTALEVLATHLDGTLIREGVQSGAIHRNLTRKAALAVARKMRIQALLKNPSVPLP